MYNSNGIGISYCIVINRIYRTDGIRGFWKGLTPVSFIIDLLRI